MMHIEKADFRLVSGEAGTVFDQEVFSHLSWLASRHAERTCSGAKLLREPMDEHKAFEMMDCFGSVSGYILINIEELFVAGIAEAKRRISSKLVSGVKIDSLTFEVVWGHSQTLMLYACGETAG